MAPLNTETGQLYIDKVIELLGGVVFVFFDNIQSLLLGDMKEEDGWSGVLPWVRDLTQRNIGQFWIHHTGHDEEKSYGTKTREWQLDTVIKLKPVELGDADIAFTLSFPKARERTPDNRADFEEAVITLANDQWNSQSGGGDRTGRGRVKKTLEDLALWALDEALAKAGETPHGFSKIPPDTCCVKLDMWRAFFRQSYIGEADEASIDRKFRSLSQKLQLSGKIGVQKPWVWRIFRAVSNNYYGNRRVF